MGNPNSNLSDTTKPIFLDSLLQEVTAGATYVCISLKLWGPETGDAFRRIENLFIFHGLNDQFIANFDHKLRGNLCL